MATSATRASPPCRTTGPSAGGGSSDKDSPFRDWFARPIDTLLSPPLTTLAHEGDGEPDLRVRRILERLAVRNLLRAIGWPSRPGRRSRRLWRHGADSRRAALRRPGRGGRAARRRLCARHPAVVLRAHG